MAQIRDYQVGDTETQTLIQIAQADGSLQFLSLDGVLKNAFSDLVLYTDASGTSQIPGGVGGGNYEYGEPDAGATAKEAGKGGTGKTVYPQFKVTNATYQGIPLYATFTNFGTYTSNDAAFDQIGGVIEVTASSTIEIPEGYTSVLINCDTDAGDITLSGSNAGFAGQRIRVKNTGTSGNLVYCKLTGAYLGGSSTGTPISDGLMWRGDSNGSTIDPVNEVTADYVSGTTEVKQWSNGSCLFGERATVTSVLTYNYPFTLLSATDDISAIPREGTARACTYATNTTTSVDIYAWVTSSGAGATIGANIRVRGQY